MRVLVKSGGENGASSATGRLHTYNSCFWRGVSTMIIFRWCSSPVMGKGRHSGTTGWCPLLGQMAMLKKEQRRGRAMERWSWDGGKVRKQNSNAERAHSNGAVVFHRRRWRHRSSSSRRSRRKQLLPHFYILIDIKITYRRYQSLVAVMMFVDEWKGTHHGKEIVGESNKVWQKLGDYQ